MIGDIKNKAAISGQLKVSSTICGNVDALCVIGTAEVGKVVIRKEEWPEYEGVYEATPNVEEQIFDTSDKHMTDDFKINPIPYYDISNEYGRTIYIGGDPNA